jgi:putative membrane protein
MTSEAIAMMFTRVAAAAAISLTSWAGYGSPDVGSQAGGFGSAEAATAPMSAAEYATLASGADLFEIQSGELAQMRAASQSVKDFAGMMIADHRRTTTAMRRALQTANMQAPGAPRLDADQSAMLAQLQGASGPDFDRLYLQQQRMAHQDALALHQGYARDGGNGVLKGVAAQTVPIIERHLSMLQGLDAG